VPGLPRTDVSFGVQGRRVLHRTYRNPVRERNCSSEASLALPSLESLLAPPSTLQARASSDLFCTRPPFLALHACLVGCAVACCVSYCSMLPCGPQPTQTPCRLQRGARSAVLFPRCVRTFCIIPCEAGACRRRRPWFGEREGVRR